MTESAETLQHLHPNRSMQGRLNCGSYYSMTPFIFSCWAAQFLHINLACLCEGHRARKLEEKVPGIHHALEHQVLIFSRFSCSWSHQPWTKLLVGGMRPSFRQRSLTRRALVAQEASVELLATLKTLPGSIALLSQVVNDSAEDRQVFFGAAQWQREPLRDQGGCKLDLVLYVCLAHSIS